MRSARCSLTCLLVLWSLVVLGQDRGLDLPVEKPEKRQPPAPMLQAPPPPEPGSSEDVDPDPPKFYGVDVRSENRSIFYVVDISGSMAYDVADYTCADGSTARGNRLDRAKAEIEKSVATLPESFRFNLLAYDCSVLQCFEHLAPADATHKAAAIGWARKLEPGGGTGTGPAVALALRQDPGDLVGLVVLLSDGAPNCHVGGNCGDLMDSDRHRQIIRWANLRPAVVDACGIGCAGEFRRFMEAVASDSGGTYVDVR